MSKCLRSTRYGALSCYNRSTRRGWAECAGVNGGGSSGHAGIHSHFFLVRLGALVVKLVVVVKKMMLIRGGGGEGKREGRKEEGGRAGEKGSK